MALHDALTFDAATRIGGPNGSIRMEREQGHDGNEGLKLTVERLEAVRRDLGGEMSFADTLHLGAAVAAEMIGGGRVAFRPGRKDKKACPPRGRLPAADSAGSLEAVGRRAGLSRRHFVALAGFHPFAGVLGDHDRGLTSFEQEWKEEPFCMGNAVYKDLLQGGGQGCPPALRSLLEDEELKAICAEFAEDEGAWLRDYARALSAASELGMAPAEKKRSGADAVASLGDQLLGWVDGGSELGRTVAISGALGGLAALSLYALRRRRAARLA